MIEAKYTMPIDLIEPKIDRYEQLNADTLEEADEKFAAHVKHVLENATASKTLGYGAQLLVKALENWENVVVKRMKKDEELEKQLRGRETAEQFWLRMQEEHKLVDRYFTSRFVPPTLFLEVETNFGDPLPSYINYKEQEEDFPVELNKEKVMLQIKVEEEQLDHFTMELGNHVVSDELKTEVRAFITAYQQMIQISKFAIEDQISVDFEHNRINIIDTNELYSLKRMISRNFILQKRSIVFTEDIDTALIIDVIVDELPELLWIKNYTYEELLPLIDDVDFENSKWVEIRNLIAQRGEDDIDWKVDLRGLFRILRYFPPNGSEDNYFLLKLKKAFGI